MSWTGAEVVRRLIRSQEEESSLALLGRGSLAAGASLARLLLAALAARSSALFLEIVFFFPLTGSFFLARLSPILADLLLAIFFFSAAFLGELFLGAIFLGEVFFAAIFLGRAVFFC